jgi:hypothetical protein
VFLVNIITGVNSWDKRPFLALYLSFNKNTTSNLPLYLQIHNYKKLLERQTTKPARGHHCLTNIQRGSIRDIFNGDPNKTTTESLIAAEWPALSLSNVFHPTHEAVYEHLAHYVPHLTKLAWHNTRDRRPSRYTEMHLGWERYTSLLALTNRILCGSRIVDFARIALPRSYH